MASACAGSAKSSARRKREVAFQRLRIEEVRESRPRRRRGPPDPNGPEMERLARRVGARPVGIEGAEYLTRHFERLDDLDERLVRLEGLDAEIVRLERLVRAGRDPDGNTVLKQELFRERADLERETGALAVRILHLGDSHIAADYITRIVRARLQERFGNAGRGFVHADQKAQYGGRRVLRRGWERVRAVDTPSRRPFGVTAVSLESTRAGAEMQFELQPEEKQVVLHFLAKVRGPRLGLFADGFELAMVSTEASAPETRALRIDVDLPPPAPETVSLTSDGAGAEVFGLSFETTKPGVFYDAIGPVGADATLWADLEANSFEAQVGALSPSLFVLMVGGNDALAVRQGRRDPETVKADIARLIQNLRRAAPDAECLLFGPMDAADRRGRRLVSKRFVAEVVRWEREVAQAEGCAFWNAWQAMGGEGSFGRWLRAGLMNSDLVHPRSKGGDLLGYLFARALANAYSSGS